MFGIGEKYIARLMIKNKIYSSDGQTFESLFSSIMTKYNPNFELVKAYGNLGDKKNDGFDKTTGEYYQVYAPENIEKGSTINDAIAKLENDFQGLYEHWNTLCQIKKFNFVLNDKYKGAPPQVHSKLLELSQKYPHVEFNIITANKLEDTFMNLCEDSIIEIVGCFASPSSQLDYSALTDVINYLMNSKEKHERTEELQVANFEEKISFNKLNQEIACRLRAASYQVGNLETFFKRNSEFAKNEIQKRITECYLAASMSIDKAEDNYSDLVFVKMLDDICPNETEAVKNAALVLASYYFELCDIFEKPNKEDSINDPS
ncbi:MAG: hypothetical protein J1E34_04455 [Oscillospiraceae bacterium]|nr:hypothetical protein [Oscillospiraceae bacterium]